jgi:hypothetical protein
LAPIDTHGRELGLGQQPDQSALAKLAATNRRALRRQCKTKLLELLRKMRIFTD